jgi:2-polyprenyl-6-methoxyphenol hydroxylase-like FAD-dependent oxidoreductase
MILGSGLAGSISALCLASQGVKVALVDAGQHPRFAIGESMTPQLIEWIVDRHSFHRFAGSTWPATTSSSVEPRSSMILPRWPEGESPLAAHLHRKRGGVA